MISFLIDSKKTSPEVAIDRRNHVINITGSSTFKNTSWFYSSVLKWVIEFNRKGADVTTINIRLNKINESSSKWLLLIMKKMYFLLPEHNISVNWYYEQSNTTMQINGERLKLNSSIPIKIIAA
jgi:hypothetical protein